MVSRVRVRVRISMNVILGPPGGRIIEYEERSVLASDWLPDIKGRG